MPGAYPILSPRFTSSKSSSSPLLSCAKIAFTARAVWQTTTAPNLPSEANGRFSWMVPCPLIFDTKATVFEKHGLHTVSPLADSTLARVTRGMKRYVLEEDRPFLVNLTHGGRVEDAAEQTLTAASAHPGEKAAAVPIVSQIY